MNAQIAQNAVNDPTYANLVPSHRVLQKFLDSRPVPERFKNVEGLERAALRDALFPYMKDKQKAKYQVNGKYTDKFDAWITDTMRARRQRTIRPEFTNKKYVPRAVGADNGLSQAGIKTKNQKPHLSKLVKTDTR